MAYEQTQVAVPKSQDKIRQMLLRHKGGSVAFISDPPMEGFQAVIPIEGKVLTNDGRTVGECILPKLDAALAGRPDRLLPAPMESRLR